MATAVVLTSTSPPLLALFLPLGVVPLGVVYAKLQRYYRSSSRELRRLDSTSRLGKRTDRNFEITVEEVTDCCRLGFGPNKLANILKYIFYELLSLPLQIYICFLNFCLYRYKNDPTLFPCTYFSELCIYRYKNDPTLFPSTYFSELCFYRYKNDPTLFPSTLSPKPWVDVVKGEIHLFVNVFSRICATLRIVFESSYSNLIGLNKSWALLLKMVANFVGFAETDRTNRFLDQSLDCCVQCFTAAPAPAIPTSSSTSIHL